MAHMESTATLNVKVNSEGIKEVADAIAQIEESLKNGKNIKFKIESSDLKKMSQDISEILGKLNNLGNFNFNNSSLNELNKDLIDARSALDEMVSSGEINIGDGAKFQLVSDALENATQHAVELSTTVASVDVSTELEEQAVKTEKFAEKIDASLSKVNKALTQNTYRNNKQSQQNFLDQYSLIPEGTSSALDEMRRYASEYSSMLNVITDAQVDARKQGVDFNRDFLIGTKGWSASEVDSLAKNMDDLDKAFDGLRTTAQAEIKATGIESVAKQTQEAEKAVRQSTANIEADWEKVIKSLNTNQYQKNLQAMEDFLKPYENVDGGYSKYLDQIRNYYEEYKQTYQALLDVQSQAKSQGIDLSADFLKGQGWDSSFVNKLGSTMDTIQKAFSGLRTTVKSEMSDLGFDEAIKQAQDFQNAIQNMENALIKNDYGAALGNANKSLNSLSNIDTPQFTQLREDINELYKDLADLNSAFDKESMALDVDKLLGMDGWDESKLLNFDSRLRTTCDNAKKSVTEFKGMEGSIDLNKIIGDLKSGDVNKFQKEIDDLRDSISSLGNSEEKSGFSKMADDVQAAYDKMSDAVHTFESTPNTSSDYSANFEAATESVRDFESQLHSAQQEFNAFVSSGGGGGIGGGGGGITSFFKDFSNGISSTMSVINKIFGYNVVFRELRESARECVNTIIDIDTAMNQLQIVTGATGSQMTEFFESSISMAKELGQSVTDVLDSIQVYSRLGYNLEDASELAEYTSILSNVAAVDVEEATTGLTSTIKGFDLNVSDAEHVSDVLITVGQNYAVSAGEILEAFEKSSAAMAASDTSFEQAAAIIAAGIRKSCLWNAVMQSIRTRLIARTSQSLATTIIWETGYECAKAEITARMNIWGNPTYFYNG